MERNIPDAKSSNGEMRLISRAVAVLRAIADHPSGLSLGQIAGRTGLARATVQRLVGALQSEGFVVTDDRVPGVRLGAEIARIAASVHRDVAGLCRPRLEELSTIVGDTVDLTLLESGGAMVVDQVLPTQTLRVVSHKGTVLPLHCTASGKAHLGQIERRQAQAYLPIPLPSFTQNTITDAEALLDQIEVCSTGGIFIDNEEFATGVCGVGLPLRGFVSGNYAVAVSMPKHRFDQNCAKVKDALAQTRSEIERAAGLVASGADFI